MKKITLLFVLFSFTVTLVNAQITLIPDSNFEQVLIDEGYDTAPINGWVFTNDISSVTFLNLNLKNISTLTGIEDFAALEVLFCTANSLTSIDVSNNSVLNNLVCNNNSLTNLTLNTALQSLNCQNNNLTALNLSSSTDLFFIDCGDNQLTSLNISSNTNLTTVLCNDNQISSINTSNNTLLTSLDVSMNSINSLNISNNLALEGLSCNNNLLTELDVSINTLLSILICNDNQLSSLNVKNGNNTQTSNAEFNATNNSNLNCITVDGASYSASTWFQIDAQTVFAENCNATTFVPDDNFEQALIDLGYDSGPLDDFVLTININTVTTLDVSSKSINDLTGIQDFIALEELDCSLNTIQNTTLILNTLTSLKTLFCAFNQLASLDVSSNLNLEELNCSTNSLTTLNISNNSNLAILYCNSNDLTSLNTSSNLLLEQLRSFNNPFTSNLNLSNNVALKDLRCSNNQLTALDVTNNSALEQLFCNGNQITGIDITNNNSLNALRCQNNNLSSLDARNGNNSNFIDFIATNNTNLTCISVDNVVYSNTNWTTIDAQTNFSVDCSTPQTYVPNDNFEQLLITLGYDSAPLNNYVPTINISGVTSLVVQNNNISDLTGIEDFVALETFNCSFNQLTSLNMSSNTSLKSLTCNNNQITTIDVSNNTMLETLACYNNQITALDITNDILLENIICSNNQITVLDFSNNPALTNINCNTNLLTSLDLRNGNNITIANQYFNATNNPNLTCVFVDNVTYSMTNWTNIDGASTFVETQTDCDSLGIDEETLADNLKMYPNPTTDLVTFEASNGIEISKIEVFDVFGKKMKTLSSIVNNTLNVSHLQSGLYFMSITVNEATIIKKLIIN